VFIPRPETEGLLEWASAQPLPPGPVIVDLCTGSAALALALSKFWPDARIVAVDDSEDALVYARQNAAGTPVELLHADVTDPRCARMTDKSIFLSPTPVHPDGVVLEPEVAQHDPPHALFGGPDVMTVINAIVELAGHWLRPGGRCAVEHDDTTSVETVALFTAAGRFVDVKANRDMAGRPRFVTATRAGQG
jgi:release factor glutamine methyltransferase